MITLEGALDLHVHSAPDRYPRIADDLTVARAAHEVGMGGICLKNHHVCTVERAGLVNAALGIGTKEFALGSITLNHSAGGVEPIVVESALRSGARIVWMPTVDSAAHRQAFAAGGHYPPAAAEAITALAGDRLTSKAMAVLDLCREHAVPLATGHLAADEVRAVARAARDIHARVVVTHPLFRVPGLGLSELVELVGPDTWFEFTYCTVSPMWRHATMEETAAAIKAVGAERSLLTSDGGQPHNPMPHECFRCLGQMCVECGIPEADVTRMMTMNSREVIGGTGYGAPHDTVHGASPHQVGRYDAA
ncbi:MAG: hypothetical protein KGJ62_12535 [Armatimonadetes bacterium]|nr:hypothetical protein [Armatimonadota bacterium]MDE2206917.1 hypothetical protein [Armatimonadota bacterium]